MSDLSAAVPGEQALDAVPGIQQVTEGLVMIQRRDDVGHVLRHVRRREPGPRQDFRRGVREVRRENVVDRFVRDRLVEDAKALREIREGPAWNRRKR